MVASAPKSRVLRQVETLARMYTEEAIKKLAHLMQCAESEQVQMACAEKLLDRGWGKARATVSIEDPSILSDEDLDRALRERLAVAAAGHPRGSQSGSGASPADPGAPEEAGPRFTPRLVH